MQNVTNENSDDFVEVERDYQVSVIEAYLAKELRLKDLMASLGLKRTQTLRKVTRFKAEGPKGLESKKAGLSNNSLEDGFRLQVIELVKVSVVR
jgi:hypothetical protein